jgi:protein-S-isoprenylcysteine O-methyltransferase Ste14
MNNILIPPVYVIICLALITLFYYLFPVLNIIPFPFNFIGIAITVSGVIIIGQAHELFKKHKTPNTFEKSVHLIEEGIFNKTRNPMYIGMFLFLMGYAVCFRNLLSIIIPFVFLLIIRIIFIPFEEKKMEETFADKYIEYKSRVKRWI